MPDPAVSLVITAYNQERYIDETLASVSAQTSREFEVVIVDDASTDGTVERIHRWLADAPVPARLTVNERNLGLARTMNRAFERTRGEFVCSLGGDDWYEPRMIEQQLAFIRSFDERVGAVFADAFLTTDDGERCGSWFDGKRRFAEGAIFDALMQGNFICAPTVMRRRAVVEEVGRYDESLFVEDWDLWLRIAERYEFRFLNERLVNYRLSPGGMSRSPAYAARLLDGHVRTLFKWYGRTPRSDATLQEVWVLARRLVAQDPELGRPLVHDVCAAAPSAGRRLQLAALGFPGAPAVLAGSLRLHETASRYVRRARWKLPRRPAG